MERAQKAKTSTLAPRESQMQVFQLMGNQAVIQRMDDPDWKPGPKDHAQVKKDSEEPFELYKWREVYGSFNRVKYNQFKKDHWATGCTSKNCLGTSRTFMPNDRQWGFSVDHVFSVAAHRDANPEMTKEKRNDWYNDTRNWAAMHIACNSSKSG